MLHSTGTPPNQVALVSVIQTLKEHWKHMWINTWLWKICGACLCSKSCIGVLSGNMDFFCLVVYSVWTISIKVNIQIANRGKGVQHQIYMQESQCQVPSIVGTLGCVFIDNETHESGVTKCTTGESWGAFSWHHSSVFHCQWTHNQLFLLLSHKLI